ncbi:MAG: FMN-binding protein [Erysipelotrichaceae bacterium]|nr:FMN-binding protein [Erysipelotrichaceae bacterium]
MKKGFIVILTIVSIFVLIGYVAYSAIDRNLQELYRIEVQPLALADVADGEYKGRYSVFPVTVSVKVTVSDHKITSIEILEHINGQGSKAESIISEIIRTQSIKVDVISGATYSSQVIKLAVFKALE